MLRQGRTSTPLSRRLLELRQSAGMTQKYLADSFGKSVSLISSWESAGAIPPLPQIQKYAALFGTGSLTVDGLLAELTGLRGSDTARSGPVIRQGPIPVDPAVDTIGGGLWHFPDQRPVTIICSTLPAGERSKIPNANPSDPDYVEAYRYADLDALLELYGHIRAVNPASEVSIRSGDDDQIDPEDLYTHVVLLGGVDWNRATENFLTSIKMPVRQIGRPDADKVQDTPPEDRYGCFAIGSGSTLRRFAPSFDAYDSLVSDVALFYRAPNPRNHVRTITICNGLYGRGTYGIVRALTHVRFRDRNEDYVKEHLDIGAFGILSRIDVFGTQTMTPDWTLKDHRLFEWSDSGD